MAGGLAMPSAHRNPTGRPLGAALALSAAVILIVSTTLGGAPATAQALPTPTPQPPSLSGLTAGAVSSLPAPAPQIRRVTDVDAALSGAGLVGTQSTSS